MHDEGFYNVTTTEAKEWCRVAAERGDKNAIERMEKGGDSQWVIENLLEMIENGNIDALWHLANEYRSIGEEEKSNEYLDKALEAGQMDALLFMADYYADSEDEEVYDKGKAEEYYRKAAELGDDGAMLAMGNLALENELDFFLNYVDEKEVREELYHQHKNQFAWYLRAADAGDGNGMYLMGDFYENGVACDVDIATAIEFYTQAAEKGSLYARYSLINIYTNGAGDIPLDKEKANYYRFIAGVGRE